MSVFSDLDIDRQERAQADKSALVYLKPSDMKSANRRTDAFLHGGLDDALGRLYRAGHAVASVTQALGKRKHGPLWSQARRIHPGCRDGGGELPPRAPADEGCSCGSTSPSRSGPSGRRRYEDNGGPSIPEVRALRLGGDHPTARLGKLSRSGTVRSLRHVGYCGRGYGTAAAGDPACGVRVR